MNMARPSWTSHKTALGLLGIGTVGAILLAHRPLALDIELQQLLRQSTSLQRIQQHQGRDLQGSVVFVEGTVGDRAPLIGAEVYELQQGETSVWIMTQQLGVQSGDQIRVRGQIQREAIEQDGATVYEYYLREIRRPGS